MHYIISYRREFYKAHTGISRNLVEKRVLTVGLVTIITQMTARGGYSLLFTLGPERPRETLTGPLRARSIIDCATGAGYRRCVEPSARLM